MIGAFPDLYPDEMVTSAWARYEAWVRYPSRRALLEELLGHSTATVSFDLPCRLGYFAAALPTKHSAASVEKLILEHTLLPYYAAFLPAERRTALCQQMGGQEGSNIYALLGLGGRGGRPPERLRYCPVCAMTDRELFGETYWHRVHQAAGVEVCPEHGVWLETTQIPRWIVYGPVTFPAAELVVVSVPPRPLNLDRLSEKQLLRLAQAARWLLTHPEANAEAFHLKERSLLQLVAQGMATYSGRFKQREIALAVKKLFSAEMLACIGCDWSLPAETNCWVRGLLQGHKGYTFVLYSLLLVLFIAEDIPAFLELPTELKPFGEGPWPCLNPVCEHNGKPSIAVCEVDYNATGFPRGTFTCRTCGFVYSRIGPDTMPNDLYRIGEVKTHGAIWEMKLRQLWSDPGVNIREMVTILRSSWNHLRWQGTRMGLLFPPPGVRGRRRTKTPAPTRKQDTWVDPTAYRDQWMEIVQQNPELKVKDLQKQFSQVFSWLRYHDRQWLLLNTPKKNRHSRREAAMDWEQRDSELAAEIEWGYEQLMSRQETLFRITATAILTAIRRRSYYKRNRHLLPETAAVLERLAESYEDFAIRRVWHVARIFQVKGQVPRRRVIAEYAGVDGPPHRDNPRVQAAVDEVLVWLKDGSGDDFIPLHPEQKKGD